MNAYILAINMVIGGGAQKQIELFLKEDIFRKLILLESECHYDIPDSKIIRLSNHTALTHPIYKLLYTPVYAYRLIKLLKGEQIKGKQNLLVFSFLERANYVNCMAKYILRHRAVVNVQVDAFTHYKSGLKKLNLWLMKFLYPRSDLVTANSRLALDDLSNFCKVPPEKRFYIPNFYDVNNLKEKANQPISEDEQDLFNCPVIIGTGRLVDQKCPGRILRIFKAILASNLDTKLVLLNDGNLRAKAIAFSKSIGLRTYSVFEGDDFHINYDVYFLGMKENPYQYTKRSRIHAHTSLYEGAPNALIESILLGVKCVASDCRTGPREILAEQTPVESVATSPESYASGVLLPRFDTGDSFASRSSDDVELLWVDVLSRMLSGADDSVEIDARLKKNALSRYHVEELHNYLKAITAR